MAFGDVCCQYSMPWTSQCIGCQMMPGHHMDLKSSWWSVPGSCLSLNLATVPCFLQLINLYPNGDPHMLRCSSAKPHRVWSLATICTQWIDSKAVLLFLRRLYHKFILIYAVIYAIAINSPRNCRKFWSNAPSTHPGTKKALSISAIRGPTSSTPEKCLPPSFNRPPMLQLAQWLHHKNGWQAHRNLQHGPWRPTCWLNIAIANAKFSGGTLAVFPGAVSQ